MLNLMRRDRSYHCHLAKQIAGLPCDSGCTKLPATHATMGEDELDMDTGYYGLRRATFMELRMTDIGEI